MKGKNDGDSPDLLGAFERSEKKRTDQDKDKEAVTREQLDKLEAGRRKLISTLEYTIGGTIEKSVHGKIDQIREKKINYIKKNLDHMKDKVKDDFSRSR